ncbi:MAG: hypothetical protein ACTSRS_22785 [Candidatus Helarchaeota archaeon]
MRLYIIIAGLLSAIVLTDFGEYLLKRPETDNFIMRVLINALGLVSIQISGIIVWHLLKEVIP